MAWGPFLEKKAFELHIIFPNALTVNSLFELSVASERSRPLCALFRQCCNCRPVDVTCIVQRQLASATTPAPLTGAATLKTSHVLSAFKVRTVLMLLEY